MSSSPQASDPQRQRFDNYEVDSRAGELRKHGYRVPLEDRPFRALEILLRHAPQVVTREELKTQLWPADVFVDFDHGLNKAIGKVRRALNDNADEPRFIETVGRRGYRFIAPINPPVVPVERAGPQVVPVATFPLSAPEEIVPDQTRPRRQILYVTAAALVAVLLIAYFMRPTTPKLQVAKITQITKSGEAWPLEPMATDGPRLYYQSASRSEFPPDMRIKQVLLNGNEETVIPGTSSQAHSFRLRGLSSDDTEFLGLAPFGEKWVVVSLPVVGGSPRRLGDALLADDVAWSHDGRVLAYSRDHQIFVANPDGTGSRELATAPGNIAYLAWSPDDRRLGFTVMTEQQTLWEVGADGRDLHPRRLNWRGKATECCGSWTPDGHYYVFRSRREGPSNLWAIEEKSPWWRRPNRDPVQLTFGPMNYYQPRPSRNGNTIFAIGSLYSGELVRYDAKQKDYVSFLGGLSADHLEFSRDGQWIAYVTVPERTLWRARSDGSEAFQITFPPLQVDSRPHWSADGKRITFAARSPGELLRIYTVSEGGNPEPLPAEAHSEATPDWMPDQDSLIYGCITGLDDPSVVALYRMDLRTHQSERIPGTDGLYNPLWSPDGHWLAATDAVSERLFLIDLKSGKRTQLTRPAAFPVWSADSQYIYYPAHYSTPEHAIFRVHVPDGTEERFLDVNFRAASSSIALAPDSSPIVLREHDHYDIYALSLATPTGN
jgi:Tol biopolymer transport system component/DNA-binding winged helix-turn-helix (wHTH) protein